MVFIGWNLSGCDVIIFWFSKGGLKLIFNIISNSPQPYSITKKLLSVVILNGSLKLSCNIKVTESIIWERLRLLNS